MCLKAKNEFPVPGIALAGVSLAQLYRNREGWKPKPAICGNRLSRSVRARYHSEAMCAKKNSVPLSWPPSPPSPSCPRRRLNQDQCGPFPAGPAIPGPAPARSRHPGIQSPGLPKPRNLDAQANLGVLLFFQGDYGKAEPHLRAALDMQPTLTKIQALLGMAEKRTGQTTARAPISRRPLPP